MRTGAIPCRWVEYRRGWVQVDSEVIEESLVTIYVNGLELVSLVNTPIDQDYLALGLLKNEGLIAGMAEVKDIHVSKDGCCVEVWLTHEFKKPERLIITSGCGGGVTFDDPRIGVDPLDYEVKTSPEELLALFDRLQTPSSLYARSRGVHTAGLARDGEILVFAEDVGRHNTIDKLAGRCLVDGISTAGKILLASGRISSEMMRKATVMGCPLVASFNSPTSLSIEMAKAWNITLVGYVRRNSLRVYNRPDRLGYRAPDEYPLVDTPFAIEKAGDQGQGK